MAAADARDGAVRSVKFGRPAGADDPYARSRDYDLQNVRTHLWFDLERQSIRGEVNHSLSMLRDDVTKVRFDSVGLTIQKVTLDGQDAQFITTTNELIVMLESPAKHGEH